MIEMKAGVFGLPIKGKDGKTVSIKGMDKNSGPFEAGAEQEARLVALGMAVYVDKSVDTTEPDAVTELPELPDGVTAISEYSVENTVKELRAIGELCGLTFKVGMTKAEMVEALDANIKANTDDDAEPDATPDDEDAPTFDAAEAVE